MYMHMLTSPWLVGGSLGAPKSGSLRAPKSGSLGAPKRKHKRDIALEFHICAEPYRRINGCSHMSRKHEITFHAICFYLKKLFQRIRNVLEVT